jgi:hypothetical protein
VTVFDKNGAAGFDVKYLAAESDGGRLGFLEDGFPLLPKLASEGTGENPTKSSAKAGNFSGATEFFFLSCALLRVGLYPLLRQEDEFNRRYNKTLASVSSMDPSKPLPPHMMQGVKPIVAVWLGFKTCLEEPDFAASVTEFSILQLEWLLATMKSSDISTKALTPDWMCKEPSRWLSHAARNLSHLLKPHHAEKAVEIAAQLLEIGTGSGEHDDKNAFSPIVVTALMRICSACVQSSVNRARRDLWQKKHGHLRNKMPAYDGFDEPEDDRNLDI